jgi:hypothetical protein
LSGYSNNLCEIIYNYFKNNIFAKNEFLHQSFGYVTETLLHFEISYTVNLTLLNKSDVSPSKSVVPLKLLI